MTLPRTQERWCGDSDSRASRLAPILWNWDTRRGDLLQSVMSRVAFRATTPAQTRKDPRAQPSEDGGLTKRRSSGTAEALNPSRVSPIHHITGRDRQRRICRDSHPDQTPTGTFPTELVTRHKFRPTLLASRVRSSHRISAVLDIPGCVLRPDAVQTAPAFCVLAKKADASSRSAGTSNLGH
jgi:hypothetical protein